GKGVGGTEHSPSGGAPALPARCAAGGWKEVDVLDGHRSILRARPMAQISPGSVEQGPEVPAMKWCGRARRTSASPSSGGSTASTMALLAPPPARISRKSDG